MSYSQLIHKPLAKRTSVAQKTTARSCPEEKSQKYILLTMNRNTLPFAKVSANGITAACHFE
jgi:hypothetical protein